MRDTEDISHLAELPIVYRVVAEAGVELSEDDVDNIRERLHLHPLVKNSD